VEALRGLQIARGRGDSGQPTIIAPNLRLELPEPAFPRSTGSESDRFPLPVIKHSGPVEDVHQGDR
jgi:hypothetical protein